MKNPLKAWVEASGLTQREAAERLGMSQGYLNLLLKDKPPWPSLAVLRRIHKETGITPDQMAGIARTCSAVS